MHTELETMIYSKASSAASTTTATTATTTNAATSTTAISSLSKSTSIMSEQDVTIHNLSIEQVIKDKLASMVQDDPDQGNAFFVGDLGEVYRQHLRWKAHLPRIEPFFGEQKNVPSIYMI